MGVLMLLVVAAFIPALLFGPYLLRGQSPRTARLIMTGWVAVNVSVFLFLAWTAGMPTPILVGTAVIVAFGMAIASRVGANPRKPLGKGKKDTGRHRPK